MPFSIIPAPLLDWLRPGQCNQAARRVLYRAGEQAPARGLIGMCGLTEIWGKSLPAPEALAAAVEAMTATQTHRGPDERVFG